MAAILWLGNVSFKAEGDDKCKVEDAEVLNWAAMLLGVKPSILDQALITRETSIRGETFINDVSVEQAVTRRDSLAKMLYQKNFEYIVERLNQNIDASQKRQHSCMLLDIFGFEVFENNFFEQFCINFANERLQYEFNEHIFKQEQEMYKSEGIILKDFSYQDNGYFYAYINWSAFYYRNSYWLVCVCVSLAISPCIDLIEKKPQGILWLLDEQARFPKSSDATFYDKIITVHSKKKDVFVQPRMSKNMMIIKHYAGDGILLISSHRLTIRCFICFFAS